MCDQLNFYHPRDRIYYRDSQARFVRCVIYVINYNYFVKVKIFCNKKETIRKHSFV